MMLVSDFFLTRSVGTIYRLERLNKRLIQCTSALIISPQLISVTCNIKFHKLLLREVPIEGFLTSTPTRQICKAVFLKVLTDFLC